jgi:hypothetical protein
MIQTYIERRSNAIDLKILQQVKDILVSQGQQLIRLKLKVGDKVIAYFIRKELVFTNRQKVCCKRYLSYWFRRI